MLPIEILMQAVVVIGSVLQEQRRRSGLARLMTAREKLRVIFRISRIVPHRCIPSIGDRYKLRIGRSTKFFDEAGQRVVEVLVLSASESMPSHHDAAAKQIVLSIKICNLTALLGKENFLYDGAALLIEIARHTIPIDVHRANLAPSFAF